MSRPSATRPNPKARGAVNAMSTLKSRDVYVDRMHRVTEHIDQHLDKFLDLETLAGIAHFSPFHFQSDEQQARVRLKTKS
jgi:AraC family transcriptional regulator